MLRSTLISMPSVGSLIARLCQRRRRDGGPGRSAGLVGKVPDRTISGNNARASTPGSRDAASAMGPSMHIAPYPGTAQKFERKKKS